MQKAGKTSQAPALNNTGLEVYPDIASLLYLGVQACEFFQSLNSNNLRSFMGCLGL